MDGTRAPLRQGLLVVIVAVAALPVFAVLAGPSAERDGAGVPTAIAVGTVLSDVVAQPARVGDDRASERLWRATALTPLLAVLVLVVGAAADRSRWRPSRGAPTPRSIVTSAAVGSRGPPWLASV